MAAELYRDGLRAHGSEHLSADVRWSNGLPSNRTEVTNIMTVAGSRGTRGVIEQEEG